MNFKYLIFVIVPALGLVILKLLVFLKKNTIRTNRSKKTQSTEQTRRHNSPRTQPDIGSFSGTYVEIQVMLSLELVRSDSWSQYVLDPFPQIL